MTPAAAREYAEAALTDLSEGLPVAAEVMLGIAAKHDPRWQPAHAMMLAGEVEAARAELRDKLDGAENAPGSPPDALTGPAGVAGGSNAPPPSAGAPGAGEGV